MGHRLQEFLALDRILDLDECLRQVQVIPADDAILDEPFARLGHLLVFFLRLQKLARVADRDRAGKAVYMLDTVEDFVDRHAQHWLVNEAQDEQSLEWLTEGLEGLVQAVLLGIGIEPAEDVRGSRLLEFDRGDEAQDVIPEINDVILVDIALAAGSSSSNDRRIGDS